MLGIIELSFRLLLSKALLNWRKYEGVLILTLLSLIDHLDELFLIVKRFYEVLL